MIVLVVIALVVVLTLILRFKGSSSNNISLEEESEESSPPQPDDTEKTDTEDDKKNWWERVKKKEWWKENVFFIILAFVLFNILGWLTFQDLWTDHVWGNWRVLVGQVVLIGFAFMVPKGTVPLHHKFGRIGVKITAVCIILIIIIHMMTGDDKTQVNLSMPSKTKALHGAINTVKEAKTWVVERGGGGRPEAIKPIVGDNTIVVDKEWSPKILVGGRHIEIGDTKKLLIRLDGNYLRTYNVGPGAAKKTEVKNFSFIEIRSREEGSEPVEVHYTISPIKKK